MIGMALCFVLAIAVGWIQGFFQHKTGMPAFIVSLAMFVCIIWTGGYPFRRVSHCQPVPRLVQPIGDGQSWRTRLGSRFRQSFWLFHFLVVLFIMGYTTTGRATYAVGGNPESARLSGINVGKTKIFVFIAVQILAVISGFMTSGQVMAGTYSFGKGWELDVIAAVVVGGTSFTGGVGTVWGTLIGVIFMGVMTNGMTLLNFDIYVQYIVKAIIVFLAVLLSSYRAQVKA